MLRWANSWMTSVGDEGLVYEGDGIDSGFTMSVSRYLEFELVAVVKEMNFPSDTSYGI
ncbi:hypothetical protein OROMI_014508 [Orobanche minor]